MTRSVRAAAPSVLLLATGFAACAGAGTPSLPTGEWTGDLHAPEVGAALGFLARVPSDGDSLEIVAFEAMGFEGGPVADLAATADSLRFHWISEGRECRLVRADAGPYEGTCTRSGASPWQVRLLPPSLRQEPVGHAYSGLALDEYRWRTARTAWGRLHVPAAAYDSVPVEERAEAVWAAVEHDLALLEASSYDRPLDAFLVEGRPEVADLSGRPSASTADAHGSTVVLAGYGGIGTVVRHEVMHVLSVNLWGVPPEPAAWIREGLATYAGGACAGYDLHQLAAALRKSGELIPLRALVHAFYQHDDVVTYLQSASLVRYLHETGGPGRVREVWQRGLEDALRAEGSSLETLEAEWRDRLADPSLRPDAVDWSDIRGKGCG